VSRQVHIFPWAIAKEACSSDACWNDLNALLSLILKESALSTPTGRVYPRHLLRLGSNFKKLSRKSVLGSKVGAYIRCNPAFTSHSQSSCVCWHLRRLENSKGTNDKQNFRSLLEPTGTAIDWFSQIKDHALFKETFEKGKKNGAPYGCGYYDLYQFVCDWHTYCHENTPVSLYSLFFWGIVRVSHVLYMWLT
jgi:hypothetical protein